MTKAELQIHGSVKPGFESVRALYEHNMHTLYERSTQLCVYHKGEKVVDLWASADPDFTADSLVNVFSSGKSLEAIAMASLIDKGVINYTDRISDHWPEFATNGKAHVTIADLMRHEGGLATFDVSLDPADLVPEKIKQNAVGQIIEQQPLTYPEGTTNKREYHAVTRGWIANEIFRRRDPQSRTIGEFLRDDVSGPLDVDVHIGMKDENLGRVAHGHAISFKFIFKESFKPKFLKRKMELNFFGLVKRILRLLPTIRKAGRGRPAPFKGMRDVAIFNDPKVAKGESPSANTHANARGLAKIGAMMSMRGRFQDKEVLSEAAWTSLHSEPIKASMMIMDTNFTQGGVCTFALHGAGTDEYAQRFNNGRQGFYGWMGLGGSVFQWHPEHEIGFGYVPTSLNVLDIVNERGKAYQAEVLRCVEALK